MRITTFEKSGFFSIMESRQRRGADGMPAIHLCRKEN